MPVASAAVAIWVVASAALVTWVAALRAVADSKEGTSVVAGLPAAAAGVSVEAAVSPATTTMATQITAGIPITHSIRGTATDPATSDRHCFLRQHVDRDECHEGN
jgi:hypothetical protein